MKSYHEDKKKIYSRLTNTNPVKYTDMDYKREVNFIVKSKRNRVTERRRRVT